MRKHKHFETQPLGQRYLQVQLANVFPSDFQKRSLGLGNGPFPGIIFTPPFKDYYQAFFWVLIDLIVELVGLIIKPFDNQTES
jgi:hypothetical protein